MAIYKSVKGVGKNPSNLRNVLEYVSSEKNGDRIYKISGINCSENSEIAFKQMMLTKRLYDKVNGRQYRHHIQSFKPNEITPELAHKIGVEFVKENFKNYDVFISTHIDKEHIHNHIIINTVNRETGMKFNELNKRELAEKLEKKEKLKDHEFILENLKEKNQELCKKYGLEIVRATKKPKSLNIYDKKEYTAITKNKGKDSYKTQLALIVAKNIEAAKSKKDFIDKMANENITVIWEDNRKNITFKFKDENKKSIRLSNLEKTYKEDFFVRENFIKLVEKNKMQDQEQDKKDLEKSKLDYQNILNEKKIREQKAREKEFEKNMIWKKKLNKNRGFER